MSDVGGAGTSPPLEPRGGRTGPAVTAWQRHSRKGRGRAGSQQSSAAWIECDGPDLDLITEPRSTRSTMESSVSERLANSIPARIIPSGPAFAFRTSPVNVMSMDAPIGRRTETRRPTRSDAPGRRRSIPRPRLEKSKTPQSRQRWEGSPSTWQEPIQTADWRCARLRLSTVHPPATADAISPLISVVQSPGRLEHILTNTLIVLGRGRIPAWRFDSGWCPSPSVPEAAEPE